MAVGSWDSGIGSAVARGESEDVGKWGKSLSFAFAGADIMKRFSGEVSPQCVFHINFHKSNRSQEAVIYLRSVKTDPFEQEISKGDVAVLMKGLGTWSGEIAPGLFSRQIEQNILTMK